MGIATVQAWLLVAASMALAVISLRLLLLTRRTLWCPFWAMQTMTALYAAILFLQSAVTGERLPVLPIRTAVFLIMVFAIVLAWHEYTEAKRRRDNGC